MLRKTMMTVWTVGRDPPRVVGKVHLMPLVAPGASTYWRAYCGQPLDGYDIVVAVPPGAELCKSCLKRFRPSV